MITFAKKNYIHVAVVGCLTPMEDILYILCRHTSYILLSREKIARSGIKCGLSPSSFLLPLHNWQRFLSLRRNRPTLSSQALMDLLLHLVCSGDITPPKCVSHKAPGSSGTDCHSNQINSPQDKSIHLPSVCLLLFPHPLYGQSHRRHTGTRNNLSPCWIILHCDSCDTLLSTKLILPTGDNIEKKEKKSKYNSISVRIQQAFK